MSACLACLRELDEPGEGHHPACLRRLFGTPRLPAIEVEPERLHEFGVRMVREHRTLAGVQRKVSLGLERRGFTLRIAVDGRAFVLKPPAATFPDLPENEHVSMLLAKHAGIEVPPFALVRLNDGSLGYLVARFDRTPEGRKIRQEDFCQLAVLPPKDKYAGSAELCARLVRRFATDPIVDVAALYQRFVFAWWIGNGDLHLKNLSVISAGAGTVRLSPAYDLLSTRLVIPDDALALPIDGRRDGLTPRTWRDFADCCGLPRPAAARMIRQIVDGLEGALGLVARSFLPAEAAERYSSLLRIRGAELAAALDDLAVKKPRSA